MTTPVTLLIAHESPTVRRLVERTFADEPFSIVALSGGRATLEEIAARRPDIVLVGAALRPVNGYEVAAFVKRTPLLAGVPVILLAGALQPVDMARADEAGCDAVLTVPLDPPELEWKVGQLLSEPVRNEEEDPSLADLLDAIDAGDTRRSAAGGIVDLANLEASSPGAPGEDAACDSAHGHLALPDFFDRVDDECRRGHGDALQRAFDGLVETARRQLSRRHTP